MVHQEGTQIQVQLFHHVWCYTYVYCNTVYIYIYMIYRYTDIYIYIVFNDLFMVIDFTIGEFKVI